MKLNKATVSKLAIPLGRAEHFEWDEALPGFGVRLRAGGKRTWIAQYRIGTKQRRLTLGRVGVLDADDARKQAKQAFTQADRGIDPQEAKSEAKAEAARTLGGILESYLSRAERRLKPTSLAEVSRYLRTIWSPLHGKPITKITRAEVSGRFGEIVRERGPYSANRARAALSSCFAWAIGEGLTDANPVIGTNKESEEKRDRVLSDHELALIWQRASDGDYGDIVRLLILTGQRREEVAGMRWSELKGDKWIIPKERTKNSLQHDVPVTNTMREILEGRVRQDGRDLVFGSGAGSFSGWSRAKAALDKRLNIGEWRLHDIRRTFTTRLGDLGVEPHVLESALNHISGHKAGVAGVYNRAKYVDKRKAAFQIWEKHVADLINQPLKIRC